MDRMKTIGVVGGVASGKSLVGRMLADLGAGVLDADAAAHDLLRDDPDVRGALEQRWGASILAADGSVNRAAVGHRVFAAGDRATADRRFLEGLLHPRIRRRLETIRSQFANEGRAAVVLDAPLLLEAGWGPMCNLIVMVEADQQTRLARGRRRGWSDAEFAAREAAQWPVAEKRRHADVVLSNSGSEDELRQAVQQLWAHQIAGPSPGA